MTKQIAVIVGSLRKGSYSKKIAKELMKLAPNSIQLNLVDISQLPLYNEDEELPTAKAWIAFREQVKPMDGFLFITPEYNRSIPAVLKNAIDVGSRPYGQSVWGGKPGAVLSSSPGAMGGFGANQHLRQCFVFLNVFCMQQPEAYINGVSQLFDEQDNIKNESTQGFLKKYIDDFANWVERF